MGYVSLPCPNRGCDGLLTWHYELNEQCDGVVWSGRCEYCGYTPAWYTTSVIELPSSEDISHENEQSGGDMRPPGM